MAGALLKHFEREQFLVVTGDKSANFTLGGFILNRQTLPTSIIRLSHKNAAQIFLGFL